MGTIQRGDVSIYFEDQGRGRPIVLIHGHTLDHRVFDGMSRQLQARGLRVVRPDLRGHGRSTRPPFGYHWSDHAGDVLAVLDALEIDKTAVLGFSLGGGVALEMAVEHAGRVNELVLMSPVIPDRPFEPAFLASLKEVASVARSEGIQAAMEGPWMRSPLFASSLETPGVRSALEKIVREFPGADYLAERRDRVERDWIMPDRLKDIAAKTLVLVGERDMPGFRAFAEEASGSIGPSILSVVPGAGHLLPLEAEDAVSEAILRHLGFEG